MGKAPSKFSALVTIEDNNSIVLLYQDVHVCANTKYTISWQQYGQTNMDAYPEMVDPNGLSYSAPFVFELHKNVLYLKWRSESAGPVANKPVSRGCISSQYVRQKSEIQFDQVAMVKQN